MKANSRGSDPSVNERRLWGAGGFFPCKTNRRVSLVSQTHVTVSLDLFLTKRKSVMKSFLGSLTPAAL